MYTSYLQNIFVTWSFALMCLFVYCMVHMYIIDCNSEESSVWVLKQYAVWMVWKVKVVPLSTQVWRSVGWPIDRCVNMALTWSSVTRLRWTGLYRTQGCLSQSCCCFVFHFFSARVHNYEGCSIILITNVLDWKIFHNLYISKVYIFYELLDDSHICCFPVGLFIANLVTKG